MSLTSDGYAGYNEFKIRQRCWAHILRLLESIKTNHPNSTRAEKLYEMARHLYHRAKMRQRKTDEDPPVDISDLEAELGAIIRGYRTLGKKYGDAAKCATTLENALPDLFTFVNIPGMEPTNNESERVMRTVVLHRKMRQRIASIEGAATFSTLLTCMLTWKKRGLNISDMIRASLQGT